MKNKIIGMIGVWVLSVVSAWAQGGNDFTIPLSDPSKRGTLKAHLNYGSITVKGTARKDVLVGYKQEKDDDDDDDDRDRDRDHGRDGYRKKSNSTSDGLKKISGGGMEIEASENNNFVKVGSDSWNTKTSLIIEVPSGMDLKVSTYNDGDIMVTNIQGEVELTNYNGEITALNISGSVVATTYNGEIKATFDKVTEGTPMSYSTYNGDIDLTFPANLKATFKMKTEQGDIYTGFDMAVASSGPVQKKDAKSGAFKLVIDEWKKGDVGGGGGEITIRNYNGDIKIRKK
ncbi:MAG TPA: DUF4097 family beta strand repeat-containing protein [Cyclobacteriaceae bacterium]|nr:DUF4097 family beta strand repeat-containing protein [Cyclobacteriaceae bacterium]